jgi:hypothetical protein
MEMNETRQQLRVSGKPILTVAKSSRISIGLDILPAIGSFWTMRLELNLNIFSKRTKVPNWEIL